MDGLVINGCVWALGTDFVIIIKYYVRRWAIYARYLIIIWEGCVTVWDIWVIG